jgi:glucokinase
MEKKKRVLGIDLGGTKILSAVVDEGGKLLARDHSVTPAEKGEKAVLKAIEHSVAHAMEQAGMDVSETLAVGIGAPGPSNPNTGVLFRSPNLPGWKDVHVTDILGHMFRKQAFLVNDANAAALAEHRLGAGRGARNLIYITVSTGIGGGVIIDNRLYTGSIGTAGEPGHMTINDKGPLCNCGNHGCWETLASGTALAREARKRIQAGGKSLILDKASGDLDKVSAETVQEAADDGDELAKELIAELGYYLGVGLANLINLFNPERIVIGGGVSNIGDRLLEPAFETAGKRAYTVAFDAVRFVAAELGRNSGVLGAALYAFDSMG